MEDFDRFVNDSAESLLRSAHLITWDAAEAEDLVQECLLKVARRWPRVRQMDQPLAYARRVLINLALDAGERRTRRRSELDPAGQPLDEPVTDALAEFDSRDELLEALAALTPRQRSVLVLRYFNDLTEAEAAEVLGCSRGTVKSNASRGLARLREALTATPNSHTGATTR